MSNDEPLVMDARRICRVLELPLVDPVVPQQDAREFGLYQEMLHHDIELGGFNQWADRDSQSGASVLRRLSPVHSKRIFPVHVLPYLDALRHARQGRPLTTLDIGCGSISNRRWGALRWLTLTSVDPLLDVYAVVRERHGLSVLPDIRCAHELCIGAEQLAQHVQSASFDFAYSSNALDHVSDPGAVVAEVTACSCARRATGGSSRCSRKGAGWKVAKSPPTRRRSRRSCSSAWLNAVLGRTLRSPAKQLFGRHRLRQIDDAVHPAPTGTLAPEIGDETGLLAVVGRANGSAKQDQSAVVLAGSKQLPGMPWQGRAVEGDKNQPGLGAREQEGRVIEAQPQAVLPGRDVDEGKLRIAAPAGRDEPV